jgi:hypothetical protein
LCLGYIAIDFVYFFVKVRILLSLLLCLKPLLEIAKVILVKRDNVIEETMKNTDLFGDIVVLRIHDLLLGFENATLRFLTTEKLSDNSNRRQGCHYLIVILSHR